MHIRNLHDYLNSTWDTICIHHVIYHDQVHANISRIRKKEIFAQGSASRCVYMRFRRRKSKNISAGSITRCAPCLLEQYVAPPYKNRTIYCQNLRRNTHSNAHIHSCKNNTTTAARIHIVKQSQKIITNNHVGTSYASKLKSQTHIRCD